MVVMGSSVWFEGSVEVLFNRATRAPPVRRRKADLHARVNGDLALRFTGRGFTSFSGLELFRRLHVDGTVVCTGLRVERAFRGYNPHHRKDKSYYPIRSGSRTARSIAATTSRSAALGPSRTELVRIGGV